LGSIDTFRSGQVSGQGRYPSGVGIMTSGIPEVITLALADLNGAKVFVESGTYLGATTRWASRHFERVFTIERAPSLYEQHSAELRRLDGVTPLLGDSRDVLPSVINEIGPRRAVYWLDGHWSGGPTAGEDDECPLLGELSCLAGRQDDIVLIDDARLFLSSPPRPHKAESWPTIDEVIRALGLGGRVPFIQVCEDVIFAVPNREPVRGYLRDYARSRSQAFWESFSRLQRA